jgi:hypothetical protein
MLAQKPKADPPCKWGKDYYIVYYGAIYSHFLASNHQTWDL